MSDCVLHAWATPDARQCLACYQRPWTKLLSMCTDRTYDRSSFAQGRMVEDWAGADELSILQQLCHLPS
jgi:hypothetical protein